MRRKISDSLNHWVKSKYRKPLVLRGARQVGKTWLARECARQNNLSLIELNFERQPELIGLFHSNNPKQILQQIEIHLNISIDVNRSLLFLDEIQAQPELLSKLRWFAEEMPELAVITAGSLLEFVLENHRFSMPVGRINYMYVEPLSFEEYLQACDKDKLLDFIQAYQLGDVIPEILHEQLLSIVKEYTLIGGLPAAVVCWRETNSFVSVDQVQQDLISTYRDDFNKYAEKLSQERLNEVMSSIPMFLGNKFTYSKINRNAPFSHIKQALHLLLKARICHKVAATNANGLPLAAEVNDKVMKAVFIDSGLVSAILSLNLNQFNKVEDIMLINHGGVAEQLCGQILRTIAANFVDPTLFYWVREKAGSSAEIDYLFQHQNTIIPIEVKAGSVGSLKSLHVFMEQKQLSTAVRVYSGMPMTTQVSAKTQMGKQTDYQLLNLPFYLLGQIHRLLDELA